MVWKVSFGVLDVLVNSKSSLNQLFECILSLLEVILHQVFSDIACEYLMQDLTQM